MDSKELMRTATTHLQNLPTSHQSLVTSEKKFLCSSCPSERPPVNPSMAYEYRLCGECGHVKYLADRADYEKSITELVYNHMQKCGFPPKLLNCSFDLDQRFRDHVAERKSLFVHGNTGTGKTTLVFLIFREILGNIARAGIQAAQLPKLPSIVFSNVPSLMLRLQSQFRQEGADPNESIINIAESKILVLDDLGAEKMSDWVRQTLYVIINEREMNMLPTYITSNKTLDQLNEEIDSRVASRIAGMCEIVKLSGGDRRVGG